MAARSLHAFNNFVWTVTIAGFPGAAAPAFANVITDWDAKAITAVAPLASAPSSPYTPYAAYRMVGMVHLAMFDAVNSIQRRYSRYLVQLPADSSTTKEAAAAAAAATVLTSIDAATAKQIKGELESYIAALPDGVPKSDGIRLGEAVAVKILEARANDGADAPDDYRPRTAPGVYVPTAISEPRCGQASNHLPSRVLLSSGPARRLHLIARNGRKISMKSRSMARRRA
ncbi:hypothetical protein [Bradyrhizobium sp. AZCC 2230]|uniref:hypothetical protein n=1 Tax=Bradyrhizobium sp. AZCC 2230 TaxID=3117021 RepID=UPI002FF033F8